MRELDKKATIQKAKTVLEGYKTFKRIAGEEFVSKVTATYSFEPRSYTGVVSQPVEKYVVRKMHAEQKIEKIERAINSMNDAFLRQVIIKRFCENYDSNIAIYIDLEYSETEFYRVLDKALLLFAECYDYGALLIFEGGLTIDEYLESGRIL